MDVRVSGVAGRRRSAPLELSGGAADAASSMLSQPAAAALSHREITIIVISMMVPVFLGSVDQSILASSLPTIGRALGDMHDLPWLITSYLIAATALTPLYGKYADIHGRRSALLIALGIYMSGAFISASSSSMLMLICGRVVQGCGGGGLVAIGQMILGDVAAPKDRAKYYVYFSIAFTTAGGCGPALGGWICDHLRWWVIFVWSFPLSVLALLFALTVLRRLPRHDRPHQLDIIGAIVMMAASSSFMLALNIGGVRYPWLSAPVIGLLACSVVLSVAFVLRLRTAPEPLIPIAILSDPAARLTMIGHSFGWGSITSLNILLPMYLQRVLGWSPTSSGLSLMVLMVTLNASAGLSSLLIGRVKHYKLLPLICLFIGIGAVLALAWSAATMTSLRFEIILFLIGVGWGPTAPLTQVALQNTVPIQHLGSAIGTMNFTRALMATILVAIFGAIALGGDLTNASTGTPNAELLSETSIAKFVEVFFAAAGTLTISFVAMLLLEEKPLASAMPPPRR
jgi:MFS family permease